MCSIFDRMNYLERARLFDEDEFDDERRKSDLGIKMGRENIEEKHVIRHFLTVTYILCSLSPRYFTPNLHKQILTSNCVMPFRTLKNRIKF